MHVIGKGRGGGGRCIIVTINEFDSLYKYFSRVQIVISLPMDLNKALGLKGRFF